MSVEDFVRDFPSVTPEQAARAILGAGLRVGRTWVPACAGMTLGSP